MKSLVELQKHFAEFHAVDENNDLFRKLFIRDRAFCPKNVV